MIVLLWRYAGGPVIADYEGLTRFTDTDQISTYAAHAMTWAHQQGIVNGKSADHLAPQDQTSRAEAAVMLQRYLDSGNK